MDRRIVILAPCAAALGACSTYGGSSSQPAPSTGSATGGGATSAAASPAGAPLANVADIPVGGGKIFDSAKVVLTQPQSGTIKAFSSTCTHAGCQVTKVADGTINCPCHGSKYAIADGSVVAGPAPRPLPPVSIKLTAGAITLA
jgi:Rieske Fe-S protein